MRELEVYHPIIFEQIFLIPEFLGIVHTNLQRLDGFLDIFISGPDAKTHSYVALVKQPDLPLETPVRGFRVAYILPLVGITSLDPTYKGMGRKIKETITLAVSLFGIETISVESTIGLSKPPAGYNDYLEWWKLVAKEIQPKLLNIT